MTRDACPRVQAQADVKQRNFNGVYGKGVLFHNAFNYTLDLPREQAMTTGLHTIRDVRCGRCNQYVGWRYEKAEHEAEYYKVGKFIIEAERVRSVTGFISEIQARL